jgi:ketosteroid isomerase-like protein
MSRENVELARQYIEAFNASGLDGVERFWHPEIEVEDPPNFPDAGRYVGGAAIRERVESFTEIGWDFQFREPEYLDAGDEVVVTSQLKGLTPHGGGFPGEMTVSQVFLFQDGKVRRIRQYLSRAVALEAAGLRE